MYLMSQCIRMYMRFIRHSNETLLAFCSTHIKLIFTRCALAVSYYAHIVYLLWAYLCTYYAFQYNVLCTPTYNIP